MIANGAVSLLSIGVFFAKHNRMTVAARQFSQAVDSEIDVEDRNHNIDSVTKGELKALDRPKRVKVPSRCRSVI